MNLLSKNKGLITCLVFLPFTMVAVTSCGHSEDDFANSGDTVESDGISICIELSGIGSTYTRSTSGEDSADEDGVLGTAAENYININDLYIMTFAIPDGKTTIDPDSELIEFIWPNSARTNLSDADGESYVSYSSSTAYLRAYLNSSHTEYKDGKDFCIVAIANIKEFASFNTSNIKKFSDLQNLTCNYEVTSSTTWTPDVANCKGIPMFGVKRVNLSGYDSNINGPDNPYPLVSNGNSTLWMLRAFAKVEIDISGLYNISMNGDDNVDVIIGTPAIDRYQSQFYIIPSLYSMKGFSDTGGTGQIIDGPTTIPGNQTVSDLQFKKSDDGYKYVAYLPEYYLESDRPKISMTIQLGDNLAQDFEFYLKRYSDDDSDSNDSEWWKYLLRNHYYRFSVDLNFNILSVIPSDWEDVHINEFTYGDGQITSSVSPWQDEINNKIEY